MSVQSMDSVDRHVSNPPPISMDPVDSHGWYPTPTSCRDFEIGIVCALPKEGNAVRQLFDQTWNLRRIPLSRQQTFVYKLGRIGAYNVVLIWMRKYGKAEATAAAGELKREFENIRNVLVVGICGGMPWKEDKSRNTCEEILLGDVVISTEIRRYDEGRQNEGGFSTNIVPNPRDILASFLAIIETSDNDREVLERECAANLSKLLSKKARYQNFQHPGISQDRLYQTEYPHKHRDGSCEACEAGDCQKAMATPCQELGCEDSYVIPRTRITKMIADNEVFALAEQKPPRPEIFFGPVGSADMVVKSARFRDKLMQAMSIIAVEMEASGVCAVFDSVVVIKGVCDYACSHKNSVWHDYAAATAAATTKAFLSLLSEYVPSRLPKSKQNSASTLGPPTFVHPDWSSRSTTPPAEPPFELRQSSSESESPCGHSKADSVVEGLELDLGKQKEAHIQHWDPGKTKEFLDACKEQKIDVVRNILLKHQTAVNINATNENNQTALHLALGTAESKYPTRDESIAKIVELLVQHGADVGIKDREGCTPLHICAKYTMNLPAVKALLSSSERYSHVNILSKNGSTALYLYATKRQAKTEFARALLDRGAHLGKKKLPKPAPGAHEKVVNFILDDLSRRRRGV